MIRMMTNFSLEIMQAKRQWNDILEKKNRKSKIISFSLLEAQEK